jgi:hypothetical protein
MRIDKPALFGATAFGILVGVTSMVPIWAIIVACIVVYAFLAFIGEAT